MDILSNDDVFITVCMYFTKAKEIFRFELLSKYHQHLIRKTRWIHFSLYIKNEEILDYVLENYKCSNLRLFCEITDENVSKLINAHTLDLCNTKVTDASVSKLINVNTLDLGYTKVTDENGATFITRTCRMNVKTRRNSRSQMAAGRPVGSGSGRIQVIASPPASRQKRLRPVPARPVSRKDRSCRPRPASAPARAARRAFR